MCGADLSGVGKGFGLACATDWRFRLWSAEEQRGGRDEHEMSLRDSAKLLGLDHPRFSPSVLSPRGKLEKDTLRGGECVFCLGELCGCGSIFFFFYIHNRPPDEDHEK